MQNMRRRDVILSTAAALVTPASGIAQTPEVWSASKAHNALQQDLIRLVDVRSRREWAETGVPEGAWAISLHEERFPDRLFAAHELASDRPVALICATGGRSGSVLRSLQQAGYSGFIDISEGMLGSALGLGWIATGLPIVDLQTAIAFLPEQLI